LKPVEEWGGFEYRRKTLGDLFGGLGALIDVPGDKAEEKKRILRVQL
jgi:hypothetical protein